MKLEHAYFILSRCSSYFFCEESKGFFEWMKARDPKLLGLMLEEFYEGVEDYETRETAANSMLLAMQSLVHTFAKENCRDVNKIEVQAFAKTTNNNIPFETDVFKSKDGDMFTPIAEVTKKCLVLVREAHTRNQVLSLPQTCERI